jgi:hypothetical protein
MPVRRLGAGHDLTWERAYSEYEIGEDVTPLANYGLMNISIRPLVCVVLYSLRTQFLPAFLLCLTYIQIRAVFFCSVLNTGDSISRVLNAIFVNRQFKIRTPLNATKREKHISFRIFTKVLIRSYSRAIDFRFATNPKRFT